MLHRKIFLLSILIALPGVVYAQSLQELAAQAYFSSRPLSAIKHDLENNKLNQEIQELLVPLVIQKYKKQLDPQFSQFYTIPIRKGYTNTKYVRSVAFSPDGRHALTGSCDLTARLWDLHNLAAEPVILIGHTNWWVTSVAFSPDSRYALTGSHDKTARLWDLHNLAAEPVILIGHTDRMTSVAFSPDGKYALTGSSDNTARLWDLTNPTGEPVVLQGHTDVITSVVFSQCGRYALTGSWDKTARLWDLTNPTGEPVVLKGHTHWVESVAFSPDGKYISTGSERKVCIWDLRYYTHTISLAELLSKINIFALEAPCAIV